MKHKGRFHVLFQDTLLAACMVTIKMFSDPFYDRGLGGCCCEAGIEIPGAARDRNNKGRGRCSVPARSVNGLFTKPFEPSPPPLPAGRNCGQEAENAEVGAGSGASARAQCSSAHTGTDFGFGSSLLRDLHCRNEVVEIKFLTGRTNANAWILA